MAESYTVDEFRNFFTFSEDFFRGFRLAESNYGRSFFAVPPILSPTGGNILQCTAEQTGVKPLGEVNTITCRMTNHYWLRIANGEIKTMLGTEFGDPQGAISGICERVVSRQWWLTLKPAARDPFVHELLDAPTVSIEQIGNLVHLQMDLSFHLN